MGAQGQGADATAGRWLVIPRTLCFVLHGGDVLLMKRAAHKRVFPNRYNGLGGHIERDEDPLTSVQREVKEECGLDVHTVRLRGVYTIDAGADTGILLLIFTAESARRDGLVESDEGTLEWVPLDAALSLDLVEDLPHILPRIALPDAPPFFVHVSYDAADVIQMRFADGA